MSKGLDTVIITNANHLSALPCLSENVNNNIVGRWGRTDFSYDHVEVPTWHDLFVVPFTQFRSSLRLSMRLLWKRVSENAHN